MVRKKYVIRTKTITKDIDGELKWVFTYNPKYSSLIKAYNALLEMYRINKENSKLVLDENLLTCKFISNNGLTETFIDLVGGSNE